MEQKINDVVQMCCEVSASWEMKAAVKGSLKGGAMAGGSAVMGGLLLGPAGLAVGAAAGGLVAWLTSSQFKPVPQILMELPAQEKQKLYSEISVILGSLDWTDVSQLMFIVRGNNTLLQSLEAGIQSFVNKSLGAELKYGD